jgi:hypothetical protein
MTPVVIESPLAGDTERNLRYCLWVCRLAYTCGYAPIASHLVCPFFMDDAVSRERADGIAWPWAWQPGVPHWFAIDLGESGGMGLARERCDELGIEHDWLRLETVAPDMWAAFQRGEYPPHTKGFEVAK